MTRPAPRLTRRHLVHAFVMAGIALLPACEWLYPRLTVRPPPPFFGEFRSYTDPQPPQRGLALWVEGDSLTPDAVGRVAAWPDMRGGATTLRAWRARDGTTMAGTIDRTTALQRLVEELG